MIATNLQKYAEKVKLFFCDSEEKKLKTKLPISARPREIGYAMGVRTASAGILDWMFPAEALGTPLA